MTKNNKSSAYDRLSEFSERLIGLAAMFEQPVEGQQFARVLPEIPYQIHMTRNLEYFVKERIFKFGRAKELFAKADIAIYHAEYILKDVHSFPDREHNLAISRELTDVAVLAGKMAMEGYARKDREQEKQRKLGGA